MTSIPSEDRGTHLSSTETTQASGKHVDTLVVALMQRYFVLKDEYKQLNKDRAKFMETYKCTDMRSDDPYEPPTPCLEIFRDSMRNWEVKFCDQCNQRHMFYSKRQSNAHERSSILRVVRKHVQVTDMKPSDPSKQTEGAKSPNHQPKRKG